LLEVLPSLRTALAKHIRQRPLMLRIARALVGRPRRVAESFVVFPPETAPSLPLRSIAAFPHDPGAFTQGLFFHDGALIESTGGYGTSTLRRVEPETGRMLAQAVVPPQYFAEGAALLGGRIYQLTWREQTGFVYDAATLEQLGTVAYAGAAWGLTSDGASLIVSDGSSRLHFVDPDSFQARSAVEVRDGEHPVPLLNELEWIDGEIWANVWCKDKIAVIDPGTGRVLRWLDLSGLLPAIRFQHPDAVANGIAYDRETGRIFVTGKLWSVLHQVEIAG
jgi:glutaminyl-peptide cyclotransferase